MTSTLNGSCLCNKVRYSVTVDNHNIDHCHCNFCQKFHGTAFGSFLLPVTPDKISWNSGKDDLSRYESSSHSSRLFCSICGSSIAAEINHGELYAFTLGTLDDEFEADQAEHMFWRSRVTWYHADDSLTSHDTYPPAMSEFEPTED